MLSFPKLLIHLQMKLACTAYFFHDLPSRCLINRTLHHFFSSANSERTLPRDYIYFADLSFPPSHPYLRLTVAMDQMSPGRVPAPRDIYASDVDFTALALQDPEFAKRYVWCVCVCVLGRLAG